MTKRQNDSRKDMPKADEIRQFWAYKLLALNKVIDVENVLDPITETHFSSSGKKETLHTWQCFCCGRAGALDRAHIKAMSIGGTNTAENLHMLCRSCHVESEPYQDESYWRWFLSKPYLGFMHPDHFKSAWAAMGARDIHHATEIALSRFGTDPAALRDGVQKMIREAYGRNS